MQPGQDGEHARVGFDRGDLQAAGEQRAGQLAGARSHVGDASRSWRHQPVDRRIRIARTPPFVVLGVGAEHAGSPGIEITHPPEPATGQPAGDAVADTGQPASACCPAEDTTTSQLPAGRWRLPGVPELDPGRIEGHRSFLADRKAQPLDDLAARDVRFLDVAHQAGHALLLDCPAHHRRGRFSAVPLAPERSAEPVPKLDPARLDPVETSGIQPAHAHDDAVAGPDHDQLVAQVLSCAPHRAIEVGTGERVPPSPHLPPHLRVVPRGDEPVELGIGHHRVRQQPQALGDQGRRHARHPSSQPAPPRIVRACASVTGVLRSASSTSTLARPREPRVIQVPPQLLVLVGPGAASHRACGLPGRGHDIGTRLVRGLPGASAGADPAYSSRPG